MRRGFCGDGLRFVVGGDFYFCGACTADEERLSMEAGFGDTDSCAAREWMGERGDVQSGGGDARGEICDALSRTGCERDVAAGICGERGRNSFYAARGAGSDAGGFV